VSKHHDAQGICWPLAIAPFELICCWSQCPGRRAAGPGEQLYAALAAAGSRCCLMNRASGPGWKIPRIARILIGIPLAAWSMGRGPAATGMVEVVERAGGVNHELACWTPCCPGSSPDRGLGAEGLAPRTRTGLSDRRSIPWENSSAKPLGLLRLSKAWCF